MGCGLPAEEDGCLISQLCNTPIISHHTAAPERVPTALPTYCTPLKSMGTMSKLRKYAKPPKKLTAFFCLLGLASCQDGASRNRGTSAWLYSPSSDRSLTQLELPHYPEPNGESSPFYSPSTTSPAKSRIRTEEPESTHRSATACLFFLLQAYSVVPDLEDQSPCWTLADVSAHWAHIFLSSHFLKTSFLTSKPATHCLHSKQVQQSSLSTVHLMSDFHPPHIEMSYHTTYLQSGPTAPPPHVELSNPHLAPQNGLQVCIHKCQRLKLSLEKICITTRS